MNQAKGSGRAGSRGGKGFYIVLFLCAAVVGTSGWILLSGAGTNVEDSGDNQTAGAAISDAYVAGAEASQEEAAPVMAEAETEAVETANYAEVENSYVWPVTGEIQKPYAVQTLMYDATMGDWRTHGGVDIACEVGTAVQAVAGGVVTAVWDDDLLGTSVEIDHGNGVTSVYANLAPLAAVETGEQVSMGQIIGSVGMTAMGESQEAPHLHFAMASAGAPADPESFLW